VYESHYGFREKPFSLLPDPDFLFPSRQHRLALDLLEYGMLNGCGFTVVTGEIGCGKTTVVRRLIERLPESVNIGLVANTHPAFAPLLPWVLQAFGLESKTLDRPAQYQALVDFLVREYACGKQTLLIVDEAQNLDVQMLEELRLMSNLNADKHNVWQVVLVGQPELLATLRKPELTQVAQRVAAEYHLGPLEAADAHLYIRHRLHHAGGDPDLFDSAACRLLVHHSRGVPRLINALCDTALVYGMAEGALRIGADLVRDAVRDRARHGILPLNGEPPDRHDLTVVGS
jgi:type II secretory pathway predicted ATPase ExeA